MDDLSDLASLVAVETIYRCKVCAEAFSSKKDILEHVKIGCVPLPGESKTTQEVTTPSRKEENESSSCVEEEEVTPEVQTPPRRKRGRPRIKREPGEDGDPGARDRKVILEIVPASTPDVSSSQDGEEWTPSQRPSRKRRMTEKMQALYTAGKGDASVKKRQRKASSPASHQEDGITPKEDKTKEQDISGNICEDESSKNKLQSTEVLPDVSSDKTGHTDETAVSKQGEGTSQAEKPESEDISNWMVVNIVETQGKPEEAQEKTEQDTINEAMGTEFEEVPQAPANDSAVQDIIVGQDKEPVAITLNHNPSLDAAQSTPKKRGPKPKGTPKAVIIRKPQIVGECLYCSEKFNTPYECLFHMETTHQRYVLGNGVSVKSISEEVKAVMKVAAKWKRSDSDEEDATDQEVVVTATETDDGVRVEPGYMPCPRCNHPYQAKNIYRHLLCHHVWKPFKTGKYRSKAKPAPCVCDVCGKDFKYPQNMKIHKLRMHLGVKYPYRKKPPDQNVKKAFTCEICGYITCEKRRLNYHIMAFHENKVPFQCEFCSYKTWERTAIRDHRYRHMQEKPYKCDYCTYQCIQKPMLRAHLLRHHGVVLPKVERSNKPRWKELQQQREAMELEQNGVQAEEVQVLTIKQEGGTVQVLDQNGQSAVTILDQLQTAAASTGQVTADGETVVVSEIQSATVEAIDSLLQMHADLSMHSYSQPPENQSQVIALSEEASKAAQDALDGSLVVGPQEQTITVVPEQDAEGRVVYRPAREGEAGDSQVVTLKQTTESEVEVQQGRQSPLRVFVQTEDREALSMQDLQNVCMQLSQSLDSYKGKDIVLVMQHGDSVT